MNLERTIILKDICTPVFIVALFTIAKAWKQPKCPSTDEWIKTMWHTYTMEYYSIVKNSEVMPFAAMWMDLGIIILSEANQTETGNHHMISHKWNLKDDTNGFIYKRETDKQA